jgi:hypothetical protein
MHNNSQYEKSQKSFPETEIHPFRNQPSEDDREDYIDNSDIEDTVGMSSSSRFPEDVFIFA